MIKNFRNLFLLSSVAIVAFSYPAVAADTFTDAQKKEIEAVLKTYLQEHPEAVYEALQSYQVKQQEMATASAEVLIKEKLPELTAKDLPSIGNPNGDVTVVEFFDYNCGYCKRALEDINAVLKEDKNVRFVFKEYPILGPTSELAARYAEAAHKQGKYFEYHQAVMHGTGQVTEQSLEQVGKDIGLDVEKLKTDANSDTIRGAIIDSRNLGMSLRVQGTPGFIINGKFYGGYLGPDGLKKAIEEARKPKQ